MTVPRDPRPVALSAQVYGCLLRAYPRRFRRRYSAEMALVFRDSCRDAYRQQGSTGLIAVWLRGLADLCVKAPQEMTGAPAERERRRGERRCSGCSNEVIETWRQCRYCGTVLSNITTYSTRAEDDRDALGYDVQAVINQVRKGAAIGPQ